ncbi:MAG: fasciclin domain-containing protein [Bacteroidota bacterium]
MRRDSLLKTAKILLFCLPLLVFQNCTKESLTEETNVAQTTPDVTIELDQLEEYETLGDETAVERHHHRITFNTLNAAIACAGLGDVVFSGKKTVYAPSDEAFAKLGLNASNVCGALDKETLTNILAYHVNEGIITIRERGCIEPLNGDVARLDFRNHRYFINDSRLIGRGIMNGRGFLTVIYAIDMVLMPPANNIVETAIAADGFNSLVAAVLAADPSIATALSNDDAIFTVFAPTDQAFADLLGALGVSSLEEAVAAVGVEGLTTILLYHVVDACATSNDLKNGMMITTLQGETVRVDLRKRSIVDKTGTGARLVHGGINILTANGYIHAIDKVLLPQAIIDAL